MEGKLLIRHFHSAFSSKAEGLEKFKEKKFFAVLLSPEVVLNYIDLKWKFTKINFDHLL